MKHPRKFRRLAILTGAVLLLPALLYGSFGIISDMRFQTDAPEGNFPLPRNKLEARSQDVEHFALFLELEKSWTPQKLQTAKILYKNLQAEAPQMSDAEFEMAIAEIVAVAGNAHTKVREYSRTPRLNRLPIRGHWFADGYYIIRAHKGYENLLGNELVAIDGHPLPYLMASLRRYIAGNIQTLRKYSPYILESPDLLFAAGLSQAADEVTITVIDASNNQVDVLLSAPFPSSAEQLARSHQLLVPTVFSESQPNWSPALSDNIELPTYLRTIFDGFHMQHLPDMDAVYVQFWSNEDIGKISVSDFCDDALDFTREIQPKIIILDHRFNGGGDLSNTKSCMEDFGRLVPENGKLYIAIAGQTFSAGMVSTGAAYTTADGKAILIGETMGDDLRSWGEVQLLRLPNSGIEIRFSRGMHDLKDGCTDWRKCYWNTMFHNIRLKSNKPEIEVQFTFQDYMAGRDPILEKIRKLEQ